MAKNWVSCSIFAVVSLILLSACRPPEGGTLRFTSLGQGSLSETAALEQEPTLVLFRSRAAWEKGRDFFLLDLPPAAAESLAAVDFSRQSVAAFTLGGRPTGGYSIELTAIEPGPPPRFLLTSRQPGPGEMVIQITTHPFHLVTLNATAIPPGAEISLDGSPVTFRRVVRE